MLINHTQKNTIKKEKLLLHTCCAVCASYPYFFLSNNFDTTLFFYNPNIYPKEEYFRRLEEVKRLSNSFNIKLIIDKYDPSYFDHKVIGLEKEPERGKRCVACFKIRLEKTAKLQFQKLSIFATTLTLSPIKIPQQSIRLVKKLRAI